MDGYESEQEKERSVFKDQEVGPKVGKDAVGQRLRRPAAHKKSPPTVPGGFQGSRAPTYSPTCYGSTIGSGGLDCPVRNGKG